MRLLHKSLGKNESFTIGPAIFTVVQFNCKKKDILLEKILFRADTYTSGVLFVIAFDDNFINLAMIFLVCLRLFYTHNFPVRRIYEI